MNKVAIYCRVSSDDQKSRETIENQVETLNAYIEYKSYEKVAQYLDDGISGTVPLQNRPGGAQLIKDAKRGLFNTIIVWKVDRFGRDTLTGLTAIEMIKETGVDIISSTEPFDLNTANGRFQFTMYLSMAELERNNILERMFIGATLAAQKGKWLGGIVPYGYEVDPGGYLVLREVEANIIRYIFHLYVDENKSIVDICVQLNESNIPSSCGSGKGKRTKNVTGLWNVTSVGRILKNSTYIGVHEYGKRSTRRTETIKREVPAIIPIDVWDECAMIRKNKTFTDNKRNLKNRPFFLRGLIKCARCGKTYYGITYTSRTDVYSCSGKKYAYKRIHNKTCDSLNIPADVIEDEVWSKCLEYMKIFNSLDFLEIDENKEDIERITETIDKARASISRTNSEKSKLTKLYMKELITEKEVETELKALNKEIDKLEYSIVESLRIKENLLNKTNQINKSKSIFETFMSRINSLNDDEKKTVIDIIVREIRVDFIIENGEKVLLTEVLYNFPC